MMDRGSGHIQRSLADDEDFTGWSNYKVIPELNDQLILMLWTAIKRCWKKSYGKMLYSF